MYMYMCIVCLFHFIASFIEMCKLQITLGLQWQIFLVQCKWTGILNLAKFDPCCLLSFRVIMIDRVTFPVYTVIFL